MQQELWRRKTELFSIHSCIADVGRRIEIGISNEDIILPWKELKISHIWPISVAASSVVRLEAIASTTQRSRFCLAQERGIAASRNTTTIKPQPDTYRSKLMVTPSNSTAKPSWQDSVASRGMLIMLEFDNTGQVGMQ